MICHGMRRSLPFLPQTDEVCRTHAQPFQQCSGTEMVFVDEALRAVADGMQGDDAPHHAASGVANPAA